jgi:YD repeat-containing protein
MIGRSAVRSKPAGIFWFLVSMLAITSVHAAPCYQWIGNTGIPMPFENSPQQAADDVVAYCNANPAASGPCNSPKNCPTGYSCLYTASAQPFTGPPYYGWPYYIATITVEATDSAGNESQGSFLFGMSTKRNCQSYVVAAAPTAAQCGASCNGAGDPISPASGGMYSTQSDLGSHAGALEFKRFYNSIDSSNAAGLSVGWRHSFIRTLQPTYAGTGYTGPYVASASTSSLYNDEGSACTNGFTEIQPRVSTWASATASYANGVCSVRLGATRIATLSILYSSPPTPDPSSLFLIGLDATRDDGQLVSFWLNGSAFVAPASTALTLQQTGGGYTLTDENDNLEVYDSTGKLFSITTRAGVVQTMGYDSSARLSSVTDSFGHRLTLNYDSQGRLSTVSKQ